MVSANAVPCAQRRPHDQSRCYSFNFSFDNKSTALVIIDRRRDFIEPGGFGESLVNNVSLLEAIGPASQAVLRAWRTAGGLVVRTREAHLSDLSDCPPAKRNRGNPSSLIGDVGPMADALVMGEPGNHMRVNSG